MNSPARKKSPTTERYERYKFIVDQVTRQDSFAVDSILEACAHEKNFFVTRVLNDLVRQGWIVREESDSTTEFRWNTNRGDFNPGRWLDDKLFGVQIKETPEQARPREKLLANGAASLTNADLLAILIRSGRPGESAVMAGEKLAQKFSDRLPDLPGAGRGELKLISEAVEKTAYCQLMAGIELGRRVAGAGQDIPMIKITSTAAARTYCQQRFARLAQDSQQEEFHIVTLGTKNQVLDTHQITVGTLDASLVHPREVFRPAIRDAAASVILVHNHPSGDPTASREDREVTRRLESAGELLGIEVLDHIIIGRKSAVSLHES